MRQDWALRHDVCWVVTNTTTGRIHRSIVVGELDVKLCYDGCALWRLLCISGSNIDCRRELRMGKPVIPMLRLFTLGRLFNRLRVYSFFDLVCCWFFDDGLPDLFRIEWSDSAWNAMYVKSAWGFVAKRLQWPCRIDESIPSLKTSLSVLVSYTCAILPCCGVIFDNCMYLRIEASYLTISWSQASFSRRL